MRKHIKKSKKTKTSAPAGKQRLQKILAAAGIDSRRKCEELILEHAVTVNGEIVNELPAFAIKMISVLTGSGSNSRKRYISC
ncbi:MAG: S4 domain-containing protein [Planctomycetota bacterium]|jgi:23S rRNA pseudouridine2605 synthase